MGITQFRDPFLILTISYAIINYSMKSNLLPYHSGSVVSDRKLSVPLFIVTVVSILTILPQANWISIPYGLQEQMSPETGFLMDSSVSVLYFAYSIVNPLIYSIRMQEFRKAVKLKELICKKTQGSAPVQTIELQGK